MRKFGTKNLQKSPNLVTLIGGEVCSVVEVSPSLVVVNDADVATAAVVVLVVDVAAVDGRMVE